MEFYPSLAATGWTFIPILVTILCVFATKRILLSLFVGIIASALMITDGSIFNTVILIERTVTGVIFAPSQTALLGVFSRWYVGIIIFLLGLGVVTTFVVLTGGANAFVQSVARKVKTRKGVQFVTVGVGVLLMIDDYFNALVNGKIAQTITKEHNLSRARASYIVDSIAAPICIAAPVSSWAVAIMGNIETVYDNIGVERNIFLDFIGMIPYHFYVFAAIAMVLVTIKLDFNMFTMKKYEKAIQETGEDISAEVDKLGLMGEAHQSQRGTIWDFWLPIIALTATTIFTMIITGYQGASAEQLAEDGLVYGILDNLSLSMSLMLGGIMAIVVSLAVGSKHLKSGDITKEQYNNAFFAGLVSMRTPILILISSWTIAELIGSLEVGLFVSELLENAGIYVGFIPFIMFISAAILAFSIGTSWGTFAIVLPIAGDVIAATGAWQLLLPAMSAVLSGAVFGDHASPISDTTVLSSAGTSCKVVAHFESQLPYAIIAAMLASVGYLFFGLTGYAGGYIAFLIAVALVAVLAFVKTKAANQ